VKKHLIAYAKRPLPGYAKTRLGGEIGLEESAGVYARLLYHCLMELVTLDLDGLRVELCVASPADVAFFRLAFPEFLVSAQQGADLGQRFTHSFNEAFGRGSEAVVVIGTDIPGLDRSILHTAFDGLAAVDVVLGPGLDGGYYLIGTRLKNARLFEGINWSSEVVLQQTEALIRHQQLSVTYLPALADIDTGADFQRWLETRS
jgi:uncharacterized protein